MRPTTGRRTPPALPPLLRPYQCEAGRAVLDSIKHNRGRTITIEIARQGGKNELSAQIELLLLAAARHRDADAVKCAPTFRPQARISMRRLWQRLAPAHDAGTATHGENTIGLGRARTVFLSAEPAANVVGHTASLLLEVDEAQDIDIDKFNREFRPMGATRNTTTVLYGTPFDGRTLLERVKHDNIEQERRDGARRHFSYDWQHIARCVPAYGRYVEAERARLGETHPAFLTQYCLKTIDGGGRLFNGTHLVQLGGSHERLRAPLPGETYVAGLDLAGGDEDDGRAAAGRDATVLTIARVVQPPSPALVDEPRAEIVEHYAWTGEPHDVLLPRLIDLLGDVWRVTRLAVDATGLGETIARLLSKALRHAAVDALKISAQSKSDLGFELLAAINGGRLKCYGADGSPEQREFQRECELARATYRSNRQMNFFVDGEDGHDDYVVSAALVVRASRGAQRRVAAGRVRERAGW